MAKAIDLHAEMLRCDPAYFRNHLRIDLSDRKKGLLGRCADPWQQKDFLAMDPAFMWLAGHKKETPLKNRFWIQRARGHSKTSDVAAMITWLLYGTTRRFSGIIGAGDKEQAGLVRDSMFRILEDNPWLNERIEYQRNKIISRETGASIEILSADVNSSFGYTPDFVMCDELTHWGNERFWYSLTSSFAKKEGILLVACNAGAGRDWKWNAREAARTGKRWYFSAPEGCIASWFTQDTLTDQRNLLPPLEFSRLWENKWQETGGEFVTLEEARACADVNLQRVDVGVPGWQYIAAVDYAPKHDYTVGAVAHVYGGRIIVDKMDVAVPSPDRPTKVGWVKNWMVNTQEDFPNIRFVLDPYQLLGTIDELESEGLVIDEFEFASGTGNYELGVVLRQCILHQRIVWYPGCGSIQVPWGEDTLETELASLVTETYSNGRRWRFNHLQDQTHHDDRAFVAGVLALCCCKGVRGGFAAFGITAPDSSGGFDLRSAA